MKPVISLSGVFDNFKHKHLLNYIARTPKVQAKKLGHTP
jgi:hypothetical protein